MRKLFLLTITLSFLINVALAAPSNTTRIESLRGEKWWGVFVSDAPHEPFLKPFTVNTGESAQNSLLTSMMISSAGRYVWSSRPIEVVFDGINFVVGSNYESIEVQKAGKTLREAYLVCCHKNFPPNGVAPAIELFSNPIYNLQSEMGANHTQRQVTEYAQRIIAEGLPSGVIVVPCGWQGGSMSIDFDPQFYPDPVAMTEQLHKLGFKVMLTLTPFVAASGREYISALATGDFLRDGNNNPYLIETEMGYQVCRDVSKRGQSEQLTADINAFKTKYNIDGFRFDCHDVIPILSSDHDRMSAFISGWVSQGNSVDIAEFLPGTNTPLTPYVNCIQCESSHTWQALEDRLNDLLSASLAGYSYNHSVPSHKVAKASNDDQQFLLRSVQLAAALPIMTIDFAPWNITDLKLYNKLKDAFKMRDKMRSYVCEMVTESARTAEPLIRHMEYQFPRNGFSDCTDQFMLGSKYLFAPIFDDSGRRMVRLPRGIWVDSNGKRLRGPLVLTVDASHGEMIYFELATK